MPTTISVLPGASVNIVLKADQPTGRTVTGVVRDILTRGNHPRGIKVRLADGRVGRVQSMASSTTATSCSTSTPTGNSGIGDVDGLVEGLEGATINHEDGGAQQGPTAFRSEAGLRSGRGGRRGGRRGGLGGGRFRDQDDQEELPSQQIGLDAYVKQAKPRRRGRGNQSVATENDDEQNQASPAPQEIIICPVCGAFEGDEAAVSHHVASHFEEPVS